MSNADGLYHGTRFKNCCSTKLSLTDDVNDCKKNINVKMFPNCLTVSGIRTDAHMAKVVRMLKTAGIQLRTDVAPKIILRVYTYTLGATCDLPYLRQKLSKHPEFYAKSFTRARMHIKYMPHHWIGMEGRRNMCTLSVTSNGYSDGIGFAGRTRECHSNCAINCIPETCPWTWTPET